MNYRLFTGIMLILFSILFVYANDDTLPTFTFEAFDGNSITNENVQEFGIQLILYGSPDALSNNRKQLDLVLEWFKSTENINQLLYTVNFSSYPKLIRGLIKTQMKKNSDELGILIYADWNGILAQQFQLEKSKIYLFHLLRNKNNNHCEIFTFSNVEKTLKKLKEISW